jgi:hypothetical protein
MPPTSSSLSVRSLASILGRNQGPELFFQQSFNTLQSPIIPKNISLNRPMDRIHLVWRGRVVIAGANYTAVAAEAPMTIMQRIRLTGTHTRLGALTPLDLTGAMAFCWARMFRQRTSSCYINGVRQPEPNVPFAQVGATFGNIGTYDLEIHYDIPLVPVLPVGAKLTGVPFMFFQQDWQDTLQLQLFFGDATSFGTPAGGTTVTFSAYGSGAGNPLVSIFTNYEILGPLANSVSAAAVIRSSQTVTAPVSAIANNVRLQLLQKQKTLNIVFKTGILLAGSSPGVQVFGSLNDTMLEMTQPVVDNKPIRNNFNNFAAKEYVGFAFDTVMPQGYGNFTFVDSINPLTYYRADLLAGGSTFELDSNVTSNTAGQAVEIVQEQVFGSPQGGTSGTATASATTTNQSLQ